MMRLISWTGWTKDDWRDALNYLGEVVTGFVVFGGFLFLAAFFG